MKQLNFLKRKLLMILGFMAVFLHSCQNDDFKENNHNHQNKLNVKIEDKTFENLMNDQKFSSAFGKIPKQKYKLPNSIVAKTVMEEDYDFIISDDIPAKVITTESLISYTFHISRENDSLENSNSFENLVVLTDSLDTVRAYIIKYNLLSEPVYVNEHNSYIIDAEKEVTPITYNNSQAKISVIGSDGCTVLTLMCPYEHPHPAGAGCIAEDRGDLYWEADSSGCGGGGGGSSSGGWTGSGNTGTSPGDGNSNGNQNGGGGNNSGSFDASGIVTTPVGLDGRNQNSTSNDENNCITLNELTQTDSLSANIKPIVGQLRNKTSLDKEWYCMFKRSIAYSGEEYDTYPSSEGVTEGASINDAKIMLGTFFMGQIHTHPLGQDAMFSWRDLRALKQLYEETGNFNKANVFLMIVCHNGEVYSLKVNNFNLLNMKITADLNRAKGVNVEEKEMYLDIEFRDFCKTNGLEKGFLKRFATYGVSIYKASDENLTNWDKLELGNNNQTVNKVSCN